MLRRTLFRAAFGAAALTAGSGAWAQNSPSQNSPSGPVKMVVPYAEGGSADFFARTLAGGLSKKLGQPVSVENQPGGGGEVGLQAVAHAPPDGRTLLLGQTGEIVIHPYLLNSAQSQT